MARKSRRNLYQETETVLQKETRTYTVGAYLRISVEDDRAIINQEQIIRAYLDDHKELVLHRLYVDGGKSSFFGYRTEFNNMIADIKNNVINCIIVKDFSRFGRDYIELGDFLEQIFPTLHVRFISILDDHDSEGVHGHSDLSVAIKGIVNASYL